MPTALLLATTASAWFMTGLIWMVQVVHYPLLARVGADGFARYHAAHTTLTGLVVIPPMLVELGASLGLLAFSPPWASRAELFAGVALVGVAWATTAAASVPAHEALSRGLDPDVVRRLVGTNWIRTAAWSAHAALCTVWVWRAVAP